MFNLTKNNNSVVLHVILEYYLNCSFFFLFYKCVAARPTPQTYVYGPPEEKKMVEYAALDRDNLIDCLEIFFNEKVVDKNREVLEKNSI